MHNNSTQSIIVFIFGITFLLLFLISFIVTIVYKYQQKRNSYSKELEELETKNKNEILLIQLEIQEQTFKSISREIHDNAGQKLTLAKLHLNTLDLTNSYSTAQKANDSAELIGEVINDLSDISRSLSSDIVFNNGLLKALELETNHLLKSNLYKLSINVTGDLIILDPKRELALFRIAQETLNNIVKHAYANQIEIRINYESHTLKMEIADNGIGFIFDENKKKGNGLNNMKIRANSIEGDCNIHSNPELGTTVKIKIPIYEQEKVMQNPIG